MLGRYSHCAVVFNGHMIVYGGRGAEENAGLKILGDVWSLNLDEMSWTLVVGADSMVRFDSQYYTDLPPNPGERSSHACVMLRSTESEGELLMFGGLAAGRSGEPQAVQNDTWKLLLRGREGEAVSGEWRRVDVRGGAPRPRSSHSAVMVDDGILVYGGLTGVGSDVFGDVWLLREAGAGTVEEPFSYKWLALDEPARASPGRRLGSGRALSAAVSRREVSDEADGYDAYSYDGLPPHLYSYDGIPPHVLTWVANSSSTSASPTAAPMPSHGQEGLGEKLAGQPHARCAHTAVAVEGGMLLFGGRRSRDDSWHSLSDTWFFDYRHAPSLDGRCIFLPCDASNTRCDALCN